MEISSVAEMLISHISSADRLGPSTPCSGDVSHLNTDPSSGSPAQATVIRQPNPESDDASDPEHATTPREIDISVVMNVMPEVFADVDGPCIELMGELVAMQQSIRGEKRPISIAEAVAEIGEASTTSEVIYICFIASMFS